MTCSAHPRTAVPEDCSDALVCCYYSLADAASLREQVNALNLQSMTPDPFSTFEYYETFLAHDEFRSTTRSTLWFLTATKAGRLVGYAALSHKQKRVLGLEASTIGFAVTHDADRPHVVARAEHLESVSGLFLRYLLSRRSEWGMLDLQQQDDASPVFPPPGELDLDGLAVREWPSLANGTIRISWREFPEYLAALSKKSRSNAGRQMRTLLSLGTVEILHSSDPAVIPDLFELYRSIEPRSWKSATSATIGRHPDRIAYFRALLDAKQPMRVSIHVLLLDSVPVGGLICGEFCDGLYALHIVYDANLASAAPGTMMLLMGIRYAIERRASFFNLLSGFGYFKVRWLATMTETRNGQIYRVGRPLFWRRVAGDFMRKLSRLTASDVAATYNPARRAALAAEDAEPIPDGVLTRQLGSAERAHISELLGSARRAGRIESLSAAGIAALWRTEGKAARGAVAKPETGDALVGEQGR